MPSMKMKSEKFIQLSKCHVDKIYSYATNSHHFVLMLAHYLDICLKVGIGLKKPKAFKLLNDFVNTAQLDSHLD